MNILVKTLIFSPLSRFCKFLYFPMFFFCAQTFFHIAKSGKTRKGKKFCSNFSNVLLYWLIIQIIFFLSSDNAFFSACAFAEFLFEGLLLARLFTVGYAFIYKMSSVCMSVRPSVFPSVRPSVRLPDHPSCIYLNNCSKDFSNLCKMLGVITAQK